MKIKNLYIGNIIKFTRIQKRHIGCTLKLCRIFKKENTEYKDIQTNEIYHLAPDNYSNGIIDLKPLKKYYTFTGKEKNTELDSYEVHQKVKKLKIK